MLDKSVGASGKQIINAYTADQANEKISQLLTSR